MKFKITKASDFNYVNCKDFKTLEEIRDYVISENENENKACVIFWDTMELLIYDYWIE